MRVQVRLLRVGLVAAGEVARELLLVRLEVRRPGLLASGRSRSGFGVTVRDAVRLRVRAKRLSSERFGFNLIGFQKVWLLDRLRWRLAAVSESIARTAR